MPDEKVFESLEAVRAHYYPESAPLLDIERTELLEFPKRLSEESLRMIQRIAEAARRDLGSSAGGELITDQPKRVHAQSARRLVKPTPAGRGWVVLKGSNKEPISRHNTQTNAVKAAMRQLAGTGGEVVIHRKDGRVRNRTTVNRAR